jgi:small subunit ribosomal protein S24e
LHGFLRLWEMFEKLNRKRLYQSTPHRGNAVEVKIISEKENPLLKRREVDFHVEHGQTGNTPPRLDVRKAVASALKKDADLVFVKKLETKRGTNSAVGTANVYDSVEQAMRIEPGYVVKRNALPEKPKEEEKG